MKKELEEGAVVVTFCFLSLHLNAVKGESKAAAGRAGSCLPAPPLEELAGAANEMAAQPSVWTLWNTWCPE